MRTTVLAVLATLIVASCGGSESESTATLPPANTTTLATTTSVLTFENVVEELQRPVEPGEVHDLTPGETAAVQYVILVQDYLDVEGSDDMVRWLEAWPKGEEGSEAIERLLEIGFSFCESTASAKASGESAATVAERMMLRAGAEEEWLDLNMAAYLAGSETLCPELSDYVLEGVEAVLSDFGG